MKTLILTAFLLSTALSAEPVAPPVDPLEPLDDDDVVNLYRANSRQDEKIEALQEDVQIIKNYLATNPINSNSTPSNTAPSYTPAPKTVISTPASAPRYQQPGHPGGSWSNGGDNLKKGEYRDGSGNVRNSEHKGGNK